VVYLLCFFSTSTATMGAFAMGMLALLPLLLPPLLLLLLLVPLLLALTLFVCAFRLRSAHQNMRLRTAGALPGHGLLGVPGAGGGRT